MSLIWRGTCENSYISGRHITRKYRLGKQYIQKRDLSNCGTKFLSDMIIGGKFVMPEKLVHDLMADSSRKQNSYSYTDLMRNVSSICISNSKDIENVVAYITAYSQDLNEAFMHALAKELLKFAAQKNAELSQAEWDSLIQAFDKINAANLNTKFLTQDENKIICELLECYVHMYDSRPQSVDAPNMFEMTDTKTLSLSVSDVFEINTNANRTYTDRHALSNALAVEAILRVLGSPSPRCKKHVYKMLELVLNTEGFKIEFNACETQKICQFFVHNSKINMSSDIRAAVLRNTSKEIRVSSNSNGNNDCIKFMLFNLDFLGISLRNEMYFYIIHNFYCLPADLKMLVRNTLTEEDNATSKVLKKLIEVDTS